MVAHAGAALPSLIGRLDSCVEHDHAIADRLQAKPTDYLRRFYFDNVAYSKPALDNLMAFVDEEKIMFGTDNPFFPPLHTDDIFTAQWPSTVKVWDTMNELPEVTRKKFVFQNASRVLGLPRENAYTRPANF